MEYRRSIVLPRLLGRGFRQGNSTRSQNRLHPVQLRGHGVQQENQPVWLLEPDYSLLRCSCCRALCVVSSGHTVTCVQLDSPKQNRQGQDCRYAMLHEGAVNFDSNACQLRKFAPVDFDSSQRSSVTLVPDPYTLSVTMSDPHHLLLRSG